MITVDVDTSGLNEKIKKLQSITGKTITEILPSEGRLLAVELARYTQPFGFDEAARKKGEAAVARDYARVYPSADDAQNVEFLAKEVSSYARPKDRLQAQERFRRYLASGNTTYAENMLRDMHVQFAYARKPDPSFHRARWSRGKLHRGKAQAVLNRAAVVRLMRLAQKRVGFGKSGWASVAKDLGGVRGIPAWVHRNGAPGHALIDKAGASVFKITLINEVNYTSQLLSQSGKSGALRDREIKMAARIDRILKARLASASKTE